MRLLRLGSRGSKLALWQSHRIADLLVQVHGPGEIEVEVEVFSTEGDRELGRPLPEIGGKGLFTAELETALRDGRIDLAVHSLKDLPTEDPEGVSVLAVPRRADPRDALILHKDRLEAVEEAVRAGTEVLRPDRPFDVLPEGALVGTSSLRRRAQVLRMRPDLKVKDLRGNVDTRLAKLEDGQYDAILLAAAGLDRLELGHRIFRRLDSPWVGAAGQGALAVQGRGNDVEIALLVNPLNHRPTRLEVEAERRVLQVLGAGCSVPLGARAQIEGDRLFLDALVLAADGGKWVEANRRGEATREGALRLGRNVARDLVDRGATHLLAPIDEA